MGHIKDIKISDYIVNIDICRDDSGRITRIKQTKIYFNKDLTEEEMEDMNIIDYALKWYKPEYHEELRAEFEKIGEDKLLDTERDYHNRIIESMKDNEDK